MARLTKSLSVSSQIKWFRVRVQFSHLNFRFCACLEQGVPWYSGNYAMWIHSETRTRQDNNLQSNAQLNHFVSLVKWLNVRLWTKWFWVWVQLQSLIMTRRLVMFLRGGKVNVVQDWWNIVAKLNVKKWSLSKWLSN